MAVLWAEVDVWNTMSPSRNWELKAGHGRRTSRRSTRVFLMELLYIPLKRLHNFTIPFLSLHRRKNPFTNASVSTSINERAPFRGVNIGPGGDASFGFSKVGGLTR
jgi:hypothetical protein